MIKTSVKTESIKKHGIKIIVLIFLFCLFALIDGITAGKALGESISIKNAQGKSLKINLPVKKIVVLTSDALEIIRVLNADDLVAGVNSGTGENPLFWPKLKALPKVGKWNNPNYELIAGLNPDLVIGYMNRPGPELEKKLNPFGIVVLRLDFYKIKTLAKEVKTLSRILKKEKEAKKFTSWYQQKEKLIQDRLDRLNKLEDGRYAQALPKVYIESYTDYHSAGPGSGANEMCSFAGGNNIAEYFAIPYPEVTPEWVAAENPDIIIKVAAIGSCYQMIKPDRLKNIRTKIMKRPGWNNISAVKSKKIYVLTSDIWTGPRAIIGIVYMAKYFHPALFKDIDPVLIHKEYIKNFQKIKYRGIYAYP